MSVDEVGAPPGKTGRDRPPPWQVVAVEIVASVVAVDACVLIVLNYLQAHLTFFGTPVRIAEEQVQHYWALVAVLSIATVVCLVIAGLRRAPRALGWHLAVGFVGVLLAGTFPVTQVGLVHEGPEPPGQLEQPEPPGTPPCFSGGDSDECVGG